MGTLLLLSLLLLQGAQLDVRTSVDRSRVAVGEEVLFTLSASGRSTAAFRADVPPIDGFALVERRERTDVIPAGGQVTRVYTLELQLRAEQVGTWTIGPVQVDHGVASAVSPVVTVVVTNAGSGMQSGLDSDLLAPIAGECGFANRNCGHDQPSMSLDPGEAYPGDRRRAIGAGGRGPL